MSLRWKITLSMWFLAALLTLVAMAASNWLLIKNQEENIEQRLYATAATLMSLGISDYHGLQGFEEFDKFIATNLKLRRLDKIINVFTQRGKLMFSSVSGGEKFFSKLFYPDSNPVLREQIIGEKRYKLLTTPYKAKNKKDYFLQIAIPAPDYSDVILNNLNQAIILFLILFFIAFLLSQILSHRIAQPVKMVAQYLAALNPSNIKNWEPLLLSRKGAYLRGIINGINDLVTRVKSSLYSMSRTSRYLAHEIRNPLTIITGEAEAILANQQATIEDYQEVVKSALEEAQRMNNVVTTISTITKKERMVYMPSVLNLTDWFSKQVPQWQKFLERPILWEYSHEDIMVMMDESLLMRLVDNFVRNIEKHTPPNTPCEIKLIQENDGVKIIIADKGSGLSYELLEACNQKRLDHYQMGIGLILCQEIASICHFNLEFFKRSGGGLKIIITIPLSP